MLTHWYQRHVSIDTFTLVVDVNMFPFNYPSYRLTNKYASIGPASVQCQMQKEEIVHVIITFRSPAVLQNVQNSAEEFLWLHKCTLVELVLSSRSRSRSSSLQSTLIFPDWLESTAGTLFPADRILPTIPQLSCPHFMMIRLCTSQMHHKLCPPAWPIIDKCTKYRNLPY